MRTTIHLRLAILGIFIYSNVVLSQKQSIEIEFIEEIDFFDVGPYGRSEYGFYPISPFKNRDSVTTIIRKELAKYPPGVLEHKAFLKQVYVMTEGYHIKKDGKLCNATAYGTYGVPIAEGNIIFVSADDPDMPGTIHHELSSVFLYQLAHNNSSSDQNPPAVLVSFSSITPYVVWGDSLHNIHSEKSEWPDLKNNYFVLGNDGYASQGEENDFNEIARFLFTPKLAKSHGKLLLDPKLKLWEFLDIAKKEKYTVYKKVMMAVAYYNKIHPRFTEEYFRSLEN